MAKRTPAPSRRTTPKKKPAKKQPAKKQPATEPTPQGQRTLADVMLEQASKDIAAETLQIHQLEAMIGELAQRLMLLGGDCSDLLPEEWIAETAAKIEAVT